MSIHSTRSPSNSANENLMGNDEGESVQSIPLCAIAIFRIAILLGSIAGQISCAIGNRPHHVDKDIKLSYERHRHVLG